MNPYNPLSYFQYMAQGPGNVLQRLAVSMIGMFAYVYLPFLVVYVLFLRYAIAYLHLALREGYSLAELNNRVLDYTSHNYIFSPAIREIVSAYNAVVYLPFRVLGWLFEVLLAIPGVEAVFTFLFFGTAIIGVIIFVCAFIYRGAVEFIDKVTH